MNMTKSAIISQMLAERNSIERDLDMTDFYVVLSAYFLGSYVFEVHKCAHAQI